MSAAAETGVQGFLSPFEVPAPEGCEGWESMFPYYALLQRGAARVGGGARGWFRDGMHFPEPMFPFDFVTADSPYLVPRPGELPDLRRAARARDRPSRALRLGLHERQPRHRRGRDRPPRRAVRAARGLLLPELGRALRPLAAEGRGGDPRTRVARGPRAARARGRGRRHRGAAGWARATPCSSRTTACSRASTASGSTTSSSSTSATPRTSSSTSSASSSFPDIGDQAIAKMVSGHRRRPLPARRGAQAPRRARDRARRRRRGARSAADEPQLAPRSPPPRRAARRGSPTGRETKSPWFNYSNGNGFYHHHRSWIDDPAIPLAALALLRRAPRRRARTSRGRSTR